jgi:hypothetical protein
MSQQDLLRDIVAALDRAAIPYLLTGSLASSLQGEPRATHDIDLVIDVAPDDVPLLVEALTSLTLFVDELAVADAVLRRGMFNVIDAPTGDKADFWLVTDEPFDRERFARRTVIAALDAQISVSTPEDTILQKLRWSRLAGGSEKQLADAAGVYDVQSGALDEEYLDTWAERLGVRAELRSLRDRVPPG